MFSKKGNFTDSRISHRYTGSPESRTGPGKYSTLVIIHALLINRFHYSALLSCNPCQLSIDMKPIIISSFSALLRKLSCRQFASLAWWMTPSVALHTYQSGPIAQDKSISDVVSSVHSRFLITRFGSKTKHRLYKYIELHFPFRFLPLGRFQFSN